MKACTKCGVTRGGDGFHKRPNGTLQSHCKVCANARAQTVCGLHTHDNLTVLLPEHNQAKSNRLKETM